MRRPRRLGVFATVLSTLLFPWGGWGAGPGPGSSASGLFGLGKQAIGISVGHGLAIPIADTANPELEDVQFITVAPRWGIGISNPIGGDAWYRGNFELLGEGTFLYQVEPKEGFAGGITAMFRYNFLPDGRFLPFVEAGAGILVLNLDLAGREDGLNFSPQAGVGFHYFVSEQTAFTGEWRILHISNADIEQPNRSLNSSLFLIGVTTFLK